MSNWFLLSSSSPLSCPSPLLCSIEYEHILRSGTLLGNMSPILTLPVPPPPPPKRMAQIHKATLLTSKEILCSSQ